MFVYIPQTRKPLIPVYDVLFSTLSITILFPLLMILLISARAWMQIGKKNAAGRLLALK